jgi:hypothetical protein
MLKQSMRSLLRKEQTNREKKIQILLRIVGLYLQIERQFYAICAFEVVQESATGLTAATAQHLTESQQKTYNSLLYLVAEIDWARKRVQPNINEVVAKLPMLV